MKLRFIILSIVTAVAILWWNSRRTAVLTNHPQPEDLIPEFERVLEVTNGTFIVLRNTIVVKLSDEQWDILTNAFQKQLVHGPIIFDKVK